EGAGGFCHLPIPTRVAGAGENIRHGRLWNEFSRGGHRRSKQDQGIHDRSAKCRLTGSEPQPHNGPWALRTRLRFRKDTRVKFRWKPILLNLIDTVVLNAAVLGALALRFDGQLSETLVYLERLVPIAPFYTLGLLLLLNLSGVNQSLWRYAGIPTFLKITRTLFIGFFLLFFLNLIPEEQPFPKSVVILSWLLATTA